jgi:hypothetical protein
MAGDPVRVWYRLMVCPAEFFFEHEQIGDQCRPESLFITDLAALLRLGDQAS